MRTIDLPINLCAKIQFYTTACSKSSFLGWVEMMEGALGIRAPNLLEFSSWPKWITWKLLYFAVIIFIYELQWLIWCCWTKIWQILLRKPAWSSSKMEGLEKKKMSEACILPCKRKHKVSTCWSTLKSFLQIECIQDKKYNVFAAN